MNIGDPIERSRLPSDRFQSPFDTAKMLPKQQIMELTHPIYL